MPAPKTEQSFSENILIQELVKSPHGDLAQYVPIGQRAAREKGEFFAHLIAWNQRRGQVRDAKVALPMVALSAGIIDAEFSENALAHLATLDPRNLVRALRFGKTIKTPVYGRQIRRMVERYLRARERNWGKWERTAMQHRSTLKELYTLFHVRPSERANDILFKAVYPEKSVFAAIRDLSSMPAADAAAEIIDRGIPFLVAAGALGAKAKDTDLLLALIGRMSPTELVTNMKRLERLGVRQNPALRAALEEGLKKVSGSTANMLKTAVAAEAVEDEGIAEKLMAVQEKQIDKVASIQGDWLVLADCSGSMGQSIELSKQIAAFLARTVKGAVDLVFFNNSARHFSVTGKTLDQIQKDTRHVVAGGGTSIGTGLQYALDNGIQVGGIVVVSDGGENGAPAFADRYAFYKQKYGTEPTVYFYQLSGDSDVFSRNCQVGGVQVNTFDLRAGMVDHYALPALVNQMRTNRFSLVDEILGVPLLTLDRILGAA